MRRNNNGFTLIELTIVLSLIGLLSAIAIPIFTGTYNSYKVKAVVKGIVSDLRLTQYNAVTSDKTWKIEFINNVSYKIYETDTLGNPVNPNDIISRTIVIKDISILIPTGKPSSLIFQADGSLQGNDGEIMIKGFSKSQIISINKTTGFVNIR